QLVPEVRSGVPAKRKILDAENEQFTTPAKMAVYKAGQPTVRVGPLPKPLLPVNEISSPSKIPVNNAKRASMQTPNSPACETPVAVKKRKLFENVKSSPTKPDALRTPRKYTVRYVFAATIPHSDAKFFFVFAEKENFKTPVKPI